MHVHADRVRETTTSTGTGNLTLAGAVSGFIAFSAAAANADTFFYAVVHRTLNEWELGLGSYVSATPAIARGTVLRSSNAGSPVNFSAGTKDVFITALADRMFVPELSADPPAPGSGLLLYTKPIAGRRVLRQIGPSGVDTPLQPALFANSIFNTSPANGTTAPNVIGGVLTTASTISHQQSAPAGSQDLWQTVRRTRFQTSTTAGTTSGMRTGYTQWCLSNQASKGGFFFRARFGQNINLNGGQSFVGLCASTAALAGEPSALVNMCGVGYDSGDSSTGNWQFMRNDGSGTATKVDLGSDAARNTTSGYELTMFARPGDSSTLFVRVENISTGVVVLDTSYTTDLPAANTLMAMKAEVRNGAVAAAHNIEVARVYIETDY
jgi:hypothetical protein